MGAEQPGPVQALNTEAIALAQQRDVADSERSAETDCWCSKTVNRSTASGASRWVTPDKPAMV